MIVITIEDTEVVTKVTTKMIAKDMVVIITIGNSLGGCREELVKVHLSTRENKDSSTSILARMP